MGKIICVGSLNMDIAAYGERLPKPGETVFGASVVSSPGGKGLNQAVAARRLGADVSFVGMLGRDDNGDRLADFLTREGIDGSGIIRTGEQSTGTALILVDARSENCIVVIPGANMAWPADALAPFAPAAGDIVIAQFEVPLPVIANAFGKARVAGARTMLNAAPAAALPINLLPLIDILVVNETELAAAIDRPVDEHDLAGIEKAALALSARGPAVVVTLGKRGALAVDAGSCTRVAGITVDAVDTAGAGDCFIGGLAAVLLRGENLAAAAAAANRAASIAVTRKGTAVAMPYAREL